MWVREKEKDWGSGAGRGGAGRRRAAEEEVKTEEERKRRASSIVYRAKNLSFRSSSAFDLSLAAQFVASHVPLLVLNSPHERVGHEAGLVELVERVRRKGDAGDGF